MIKLDMLGFFTLGLFGGFGHCIGMCHPFVLYISGKFTGKNKGYLNLFIPHAKYNAGRIVTYIIIGSVAGGAGSIGNVIGNIAGIQKVTSIAAGGVLILYGVLSLAGINPMLKIEEKVSGDRTWRLFNRLQPESSFLTGMILGLLPCGLLYSAFIAAASGGSIVSGGISLLLFGTGTSFALMLTALFGNYLMRKRQLFQTLSFVLIAVMGGYFLYSGIIS